MSPFVSHLAGMLVMIALAASENIHFEDVTRQAGIEFHHHTGASSRRYMVETFGGGVLVLDYDVDGLPDLLFIDGGSLPGYQGEPTSHRLYRNRGDGSFRDVTERAGIERPAYGMGGAAGDVDNDGDPDLYLTAFGRDTFYRNNGDGTFTDQTAELGFDNELWSTSASFFDLDADGFVDLYVANYLDFAVDNHKRCLLPGKDVTAYCHPNEYQGRGDRLYRSLAGSAFEEIGKEAGIFNPQEGKGLGVAVTDYDDDGAPDVYVANDSTRNFLFHNEGGVRFLDVAFEAGVGFNEQGLAEAGMGVDWGDVDRDGHLDVIVTNFDFEKNTLYRNLGNGFFVDATASVKLGDRSMVELGFGCDLADFDNDGWLDLIVVNGHIQDNVSEVSSHVSYAQPGQFFRNEDGVFVDLSALVGEPLRRARVGRGLATLDYDRDGRLDIAIANNGGPAELLRNQGLPRQSWVGLELVGTSSNREGIGGRLETRVGGRIWIEEVRTGSSYLAQNERALRIGLGQEDRTGRLHVRWPSGRRDELDALEAGSVYIVKEGVGVLGRQR